MRSWVVRHPYVAVVVLVIGCPLVLLHGAWLGVVDALGDYRREWREFRRFLRDRRKEVR